MGWKEFFKLTKPKIVVIIIIFVISKGIAFYIGSQSPNTILCEPCKPCDLTTEDCPPCSCPNNAGVLAIPLMIIGIIPNLIIAYLITNIIFYFNK